MPDKQILAFGGGQLFYEPERPVLIEYMLGLSNSAKPSIGMVGTAKGDSAANSENFFNTFEPFNCIPSELKLFAGTPDLHEYVFAQDIIFVGGGNTKSMLAVWKEWGLDEILREAWEAGIVLSGLSAGAICWFEQGITDSWADKLRSMPTLGMLPGSCCPHFDGEKERRPTYEKMIASGEVASGIAIDDASAAYYRDTTLHESITSVPGSGVYRFEASETGFIETALPTTVL